MAGVRLVNVSKVFRTRQGVHTAVDKLNLEVRNGEFVSLVGPSGCGKTTTLRMLAGLEAPTAGEIYFGEARVTTLAPQKRNISMVFQNYAIFPHMLVGDNIGYGLKLAGVPKGERDQKALEAAQLLGIAHLLDRFPRQLSGGQRQRVAVARALVRHPEIILMDEPLSNLDAKLRDETRAELKALHQRLRNTVIYVTHDQLEAMTLSDRIAVMKDGVLQQFATPWEIFHRPANVFVATFVGTPAMNLFPGRIQADNGTITLQTLGLSLGIRREMHGVLPATDLTVGVRPTSLRLAAPGTADTAECVVEVVEPVGHQQIVHLTCGGRKVLAMVPDGVPAAPGDRVGVQFQPEEVHLFDTVSGKTLCHGLTGASGRRAAI